MGGREKTKTTTLHGSANVMVWLNTRRRWKCYQIKLFKCSVFESIRK